MKTLFCKNSFTILFLITCLTINAQVEKVTEITNKNIKDKISTLSKNQIDFTIQDTVIQSDSINESQRLRISVIKLKINKNVCRGLSYQLFDNSGTLITTNPIIKTNTTILLHNTESENYVLNIIKGNENVKTFGFYH